MSILIGYGDAIDLLDELIRSGRSLLEHRPLTETARDQWEVLAASYLKLIYGPKSDEDEAVFHHTWASLSSFSVDEKSLETKRASELERQISALEALSQTLGRFAILKANNEGIASKGQDSNDRIFLVHGHTDAPKYEVARFLEQQGLKVIILHEMPNRGRAIIEKFEDYSDVGFAVVLLTADDRGGSNKSETLEPRARQNVIFEMGYFLGKLGRQRVCALHEEGVEIPSDYGGVIYIPFDSFKGWKLLLERELREAGISIDLNKR